MIMPGRTYTASSALSYRYGFNGKENDFEAKTGYQSYGNREYDELSGRFISVDPITSKYPYLTPYQFASNRPIDGVDLDGLEFFKKVTTQYTIDYKPVLTTPNVLTGAGNAVHNALAFVWNGTLGAVMEGGKGVNNYLAGGYKEQSSAPDPVYDFMESTNEMYRYHTRTLFKQQVSDFGNAATDLKNYEIIPSLLLFHTLSTPKIPIASSWDIIGSRVNTATKFYEEAGFNANDALQHLEGVDFSKQVETITLKKGTIIQQWVGKRGVGDYFTTLENGTTQNVGLNDYDKRVLKQYTITKDTKVLKSTASDYQGTTGGGTQYFSPQLKENVTPATTSTPSTSNQ